MKTRLSLTLGLLVVLLIAGHVSAAPPPLVTLDEYGTALLTKDGVTIPLAPGFPIVGGGVAYPFELWGALMQGTSDIISGSLVVLDGDGRVSDTIIFDNPQGWIRFYSDGTDGFDSPADILPPLPQCLGVPPNSCSPRIFLETGPEGDNGFSYSAVGFAPGQPRGQSSTDYRFISDGRIPEPTSLVLLVSGCVGLAGMEWRRRLRLLSLA